MRFILQNFSQIFGRHEMAAVNCLVAKQVFHRFRLTFEKLAYPVISCSSEGALFRCAGHQFYSDSFARVERYGQWAFPSRLQSRSRIRFFHVFGSIEEIVWTCPVPTKTPKPVVGLIRGIRLEFASLKECFSSQAASDSCQAFRFATDFENPN